VIVAENEFVFPPVTYSKIDMWRDEPLFRQKIVERLRIKNRVRISCIAQRISEQTADSQMIARRPASIRNSRTVPILIVRTRVVRVESARADRVVEVVDLAVALEAFAECIVRSAFTAERDPRRSIASLGENLNDAGESARAVNCALRTANDFNPLDVVRGQVREIKLTGETLIDRNAVEEHLGMRAIQTAREHGSELTWCSCLHNRQSGNSAKRVAHALDLFLFNIFRRDHAHAGGRFLFGNFGARSGNDHRFGRRFAG